MIKLVLPYIVIMMQIDCVMAQKIVSISLHGSSYTISSTFIEVTGASVTIDVSGADKVNLISSFTPSTNAGNSLDEYKIVDESNPDIICSEEIQRAYNGTEAKVRLYIIFDVSDI